MICRRADATVVLFCSIALCETSPAAVQAIPDAVAAKGEAMVLTVHAEGAQVYDFRAGDGRKLAWVVCDRMSDAYKIAQSGMVCNA